MSRTTFPSGPIVRFFPPLMVRFCPLGIGREPLVDRLLEYCDDDDDEDDDEPEAPPAFRFPCHDDDEDEEDAVESEGLAGPDPALHESKRSRSFPSRWASSLSWWYPDGSCVMWLLYVTLGSLPLEAEKLVVELPPSLPLFDCPSLLLVLAARIFIEECIADAHPEIRRMSSETQSDLRTTKVKEKEEFFSLKKISLFCPFLFGF